MTTPISEPLLTNPYVGVAEFKAAPTYLDTQDLIENGDQVQQDAELFNQLLKASSWAWNFCGQPLHAHSAYDQTEARVDRWGRIWIHPKNTPIRSVTGMAFGPDPTLLTALTATQLTTQTWVEDQRGLVITATPMSGYFLGSLQFGNATPAHNRVYVQYQYVAGYANTYLTAPAVAGATSLTVADPTGFTPATTTLWSTSVGGSIARIWDPAAEEAVSVANNYVTGANPVTLSTGLQQAHAANVQVSEFPPEIRQAVVSYAIGLMLRDNTAQDMPFPGSPGPVARRSGSRGVAGGLIDEAERLLMPYRRTR